MTPLAWFLLFVILLVVACIIAWSRHVLKPTSPAGPALSDQLCPACKKPMSVSDLAYEYPSDFGDVCKACFLEIHKEWEVFTPEYDYFKMFYDVMLPDGTVVEHCWPNAGFMNAINADNRKFKPSDNVKVRLSRTHPMDD